MAKYPIKNPQTINVLLIEDSNSDARLIKEFLNETEINNVLHTVRDGMEALDYLRRTCNHDIHCPDIVILDLNLPGMGGIDVLKEIKSDDNLKKIPVLILSTSTAQEDIQECYDNYANCYLVKPANFDNFVKVMESIKEFWFNIVKLPYV